MSPSLLSIYQVDLPFPWRFSWIKRNILCVCTLKVNNVIVCSSITTPSPFWQQSSSQGNEVTFLKYTVRYTHLLPVGVCHSFYRECLFTSELNVVLTGLSGIAFAAHVPKNSDKQMEQLVEEIMGDHERLVLDLLTLPLQMLLRLWSVLHFHCTTRCHTI